MQACRQAGVLIAAVALKCRLNANLLRRWVAEHEIQETDAAAPAGKTTQLQPASFIPLPLKLAKTAASTQDIVIEIRRDAVTVTVRWIEIAKLVLTTPAERKKQQLKHRVAGEPAASRR